MIRIALLMFMVAFFSAFAWKNWFVSLCAAILLVAVIEHPDFPKGIAGIPGLNPWNFLIGNVLLAWLSKRRAEGLVWDLPPVASKLLLCALGVVVVGLVRLLVDGYPEREFTASYIVSEYLINTIKWVLPALMLFDACRTRRRVTIALAVILLLYFLLAVQVIKWMPLGEVASSGGDLSKRASKITEKEIGYNRVTLSMMLAGASWACMAAIPLLRKNSHRFILLAVSGAIVLGQALTGGRTGYVTWIAIGIALAALRWRKLLFLLPVGVAIISIAVPSVRERMMQGFGGKKGNFEVATSTYEMTAGRDIAWPIVIDEIRKAPFFGNGRQSMVTTGTRDYLWDNFGESFPHPHQAYLEQLMDNGIFGCLLVMSLYLYALFYGLPLIFERRDPLICAVGCASFCLISALMIGGFGGQTFYPREGSVGMWAAIGLMFRVAVQRRSAAELGQAVFPDQLQASYFVGGESDGEFQSSIDSAVQPG